MHMDELLFEIVQESDGGYSAECLTENIFTQADSWDEVRQTFVKLSPHSSLIGRSRQASAYISCGTK
jgi:hypothetical protein